MKDEKIMRNEKAPAKTSDEAHADQRLRERLQKAVNSEKAPDELRDRIRRMIRE